MPLNVKVASSPTSWGVSFASDPLQPPWYRFLDEVSRAGYRWIESGGLGYLPTDPRRLSAQLVGRGLSICGGRVMRNYLFDDEQESIRAECFGLAELLSAAGAEAIILIEGLYREKETGRLIDEPELDEARFKLLVERVVELARALRENFPLKTYFHPHAETHVCTEEHMDRFFELAADPDLGQVLDTGHHAYCGGDPNSYMARNHARIPYVHLKNIHPEVHARCLAEGTGFLPSVRAGVFCEPEYGLFDLRDFKRVLEEVGFDGFAVVEQDLYPVETFAVPEPIATRTRGWLSRNGFG